MPTSPGLRDGYSSRDMPSSPATHMALALSSRSRGTFKPAHAALIAIVAHAAPFSIPLTWIVLSSLLPSLTRDVQAPLTRPPSPSSLTRRHSLCHSRGALKLSVPAHAERPSPAHATLITIVAHAAAFSLPLTWSPLIHSSSGFHSQDIFSPSLLCPLTRSDAAPLFVPLA